jgi:transposase
MDEAGWHKAKALRVQDSITILHRPPYSPELNPVERLWGSLRSHDLSNRVYEECSRLRDAGAQAWRQLTPNVIRSLCACDYVGREEAQKSV